ncbi:hypothetical protein WCN91_02875 [Pseudoalteromonas sp. YIC-827]|uniref:Big-1 domain-containing protein n=1 Tax=Pseudoalteromonas qingdaonensis TaxID=3131913 RepID=A0ABU9MSW4_9GAMM
MRFMRLLCASILSLLLVACGGGGSLESNGNGEIGSGGNGGTGGTVTTTYTITIEFEDRVVTFDEPLEILATVKTSEGDPVVSQVVNFDTSLGSFDPSTGTAKTNADGVATIKLEAGTIEGAGTVVASYENVSAKLGFVTAGDEPITTEDGAALNIRILQNCPDGWRDVDRSQVELDPTQCELNDNLSTEPAIVFIKVTRDNSSTPIRGAVVTGVTTKGHILEQDGQSRTDNFGIALLNLSAGNDDGTGQVTVDVLDASQTTSFEINAVQLVMTLDTGLAEGEVLAAGSTTIISANLALSTGESFTTPVDVKFTSSCAASTPPLATIDEVVTSIGGKANATYRANGCNGDDVVTATLSTGQTASVTLPVAVAETGSIEYLGATNPVLAIKGTGGESLKELSVLTFRLLDVSGNPVPQKEMNFELTQNPGGAVIDSTSQFTNNNGDVMVTVRSGLTAGVLKVKASHLKVDGGTEELLTSLSNGVTVTTGVADQNSFTLAAAQLNPEALNQANVVVDLTVLAADKYNNFVPDGTEVYITTEGGAVGTIDGQSLSEQLLCRTVDGVCNAQWRSQNPIPYHHSIYKNSVADKCDRWFGAAAPCTYGIRESRLDAAGNIEAYLDESGQDLALNQGLLAPIDRPLGGRATIIAMSNGEESFVDLNNNGRFDAGEFDAVLADLSEAFVDNNENGIYDGATAPADPLTSNGGENEIFFDKEANDSLNGVFDEGNGIYNGLLCQDETLDNCSRDLVDVREDLVMVMSGSEAYFRAVTPMPNVGCQAVLETDFISLESSDTLNTCDINGIDISSSTPYEVIDVDVYMSDVHNNPLPAGTQITLSADNGVLSGTTSYTVPSTNNIMPLAIGVTISRETDPNGKAVGSLSVEYTTPSGLVGVKKLVTIKDEG